MANKGSSETSGGQYRFWITVLYYLAVIALIVSIVFMNSAWNKRRSRYDQLVKEASAQDAGFAIELQKMKEAREEASEEDAEDAIVELPETPDR